MARTVISGSSGSATLNPAAYDRAALTRLAEKTEYEAWLLEAVYEIAEQRLFRRWPDAVVYSLTRAQPEFIVHLSGNFTIGDWRPGFLKAGAPLVFVSAFKLLDMLIEWVLEENGSPATFRFQQKIDRLSRAPIFPGVIEARPWLKERLIGLYRGLEPLRGTIIHGRHFTSTDGNLRVAASKGGLAGPPYDISHSDLRSLALIILCVLRYIDGSWSFTEFREKTLRHGLDGHSALHGLGPLGQKEPYYPTVRVFSTAADPRQVDIAAIRSDLAAHYPNNDCMFDLRVLMVMSGTVVDAFLFPWAVVRNGDSSGLGLLNFGGYRVPRPDDIKVKDIEMGAG